MPSTRSPLLIAPALLAACCAAFAPAPVDRGPKGGRRMDEERLQGTWEQVSQAFDGQAAEDTKRGEYTAVFARRHLSFLTGGKEVKVWSFSLDSSASPKRLDLRDGDGKLLRCIYRLEGDRLTVAYDRPGAARPARIEGGPGVWVQVYRRARRGN